MVVSDLLGSWGQWLILGRERWTFATSLLAPPVVAIRLLVRGQAEWQVSILEAVSTDTSEIEIMAPTI